MIQYERINVFDGIDINRSNKSKECMICHYLYFKDIGYKYEQYVCNGYHDLSLMAYDLIDFIILKYKRCRL